ncbi:MAG: hypothetical protein EPN24_00885 [Candidatus Methanoperedens sp.]|nr:MAG: hypothetical protein EPN24_00885 [Candidatus Methanoperedens sp.]
MKIQWKCSMCGYQFEGDSSPPERCPSCKEACTFIDASLTCQSNGKYSILILPTKMLQLCDTYSQNLFVLA